MGPKNALSGDKNHDIFHPDIIIYDIFLMILTWEFPNLLSKKVCSLRIQVRLEEGNRDGVFCDVLMYQVCLWRTGMQASETHLLTLLKVERSWNILKSMKAALVREGELNQ